MTEQETRKNCIEEIRAVMEKYNCEIIMEEDYSARSTYSEYAEYDIVIEFADWKIEDVNCGRYIDRDNVEKKGK